MRSTAALASRPHDGERPSTLWRRGARALLRTLRIVLVVALALWALYLVLFNVAASTPLLGKLLNRDPQTLLVHYERAWSVVPGHLHVRGLTIRSLDSHVQFELALDRVTFDVSLPAFVKKRFVVTKARGTGISFHARTLVPSPRATPEYMDRLPVISGLGRMPLATQKPPGEDVWNDAKWSLITFHLEDLVAEDVREIWVDDLVVRGLRKVSGGFYLKPIRTTRVGPVDVELANASFGAEGREVADAVRGQARVHVGPFDPRDHEQNLLALSRLEADLAGRVVDLGALPGLAGKAEGEADVPHLHARFDAGRLDADVEARGAQVHVQHEVASATFAAEVRARAAHVPVLAERDDPPGDASLDVVVSDASVHTTKDAPLATIPKVTLRASSKALSARDPLANAAFDVAVDDARVHDGAGWARILPADVSVAHEGRVSASAKGTLERGVVRAKTHATTRGLAAAVKETRVGGDLDVSASGDFDVERRLVQGTADVVVSNIDARVRTGRATARRIDATVAAHGLSLREPSLDALDLHVVSTGAELPDVRVLNMLVGEKSAVSFERGRATASVGFELRTTPAGRKAEGTARIAVKEGLLHFRGLRLLGDFGFDTHVKRADEHASTLVLDGARATLHDVRVEGGGPDVPKFSAEVVLPHARLRPMAPVLLEATVVAHASDAGPVLDAAVPKMPGIVVSAIAGKPLEASAELTAGAGGMRVEDLDVRAGEVRVRGGYGASGDRARGAVIVELGRTFSAGVGLGDEAGVRLFDLHPWFQEQERAAAKLGPDMLAPSGTSKAKR